MDGPADLAAQNLFRHATFPLFLLLSNANNRHQVMFECGRKLAVNDIVCSGEVLAALGVAKDHMTDARAASIEAEISPVYAPSLGKCISCAPTSTSEPFTDCNAAGRSTKGGQITISPSVLSLTKGKKI